MASKHHQRGRSRGADEFSEEQALFAELESAPRTLEVAMTQNQEGRIHRERPRQNQQGRQGSRHEGGYWSYTREAYQQFVGALQKKDQAGHLIDYFLRLDYRRRADFINLGLELGASAFVSWVIDQDRQRQEREAATRIVEEARLAKERRLERQRTALVKALSVRPEVLAWFRHQPHDYQQTMTGDGALSASAIINDCEASQPKPVKRVLRLA